MSRNTFLNYLKTIALTMLAALIAVIAFLAVIQHQVYESQDRTRLQDDTIDYSLIGVLIEKNKFLEAKYPDNYRINLKLGILYEIKKDYKNSEIEYKNAINKAPYNEYKPAYKLALLYLETNRLDNAQATMDNIEEKPDKKLIKYKAAIYNKLGDKYYNQGDYEDAAFKYQKSLVYYKIIKLKAEENLIKGNLASSYVYLAEEKVNQMRIDEAINYLQLAKSIIDAPIIKYKLGLLLMSENPELASHYFDDVFKTAPELINYDNAYKFLSDLAAKEELEGNTTQAELYKFKIKLLKDYFKDNVLSVEDLSLEYAEGRISLNLWKQKYIINIELKFKNVSKYDLDSLYLDIVFKDGNRTISNYSEQVVDKTSVLKSGAQSPIISVKTSIDKTKEDKSPKKITAEVYISKTEHSYKLLLKTFELQEKVKEKRPNKFLVRIALFIQSITSKLPAFLF